MSGLVQMPWRPVLVRDGGPAELYAWAEAEIEEWLVEAEEEAEAIIDRAISVARRDSARIRADATEYAAHTLARAEREAARMRDEASEAVSRLLRQARAEAQRIKASARPGIEATTERGDDPEVETPAPRVEATPAPAPISASTTGAAAPPALAPAPLVRVPPATTAVPAGPQPVRAEAPYLTRPVSPGTPPLLDGLDDVTPRRRWRMPLVRRGRRVA